MHRKFRNHEEKKVHFNKKVKVYYIEISEECINYRKSSWIQYALDRERFNRRIKNLNSVLSVYLNKMLERTKEI